MSGIVLPAIDTALDCSVAPGYSALGYWLRGLRWDNAVAGRLDGGAAVVTGASSGLGVAAVEGLARAGARVHLVVRDRERGERARDEVLQRVGAAADLRVALCDLAELESVARLAADLAEREPDLAVLVNNAGVLAERREPSSSGAELTFATNVLGPFALTERLLPALRAGTPGRVVIVSSGGMYTARLDGADLQLDHRKFHGPRFYAHTKRAEVVLNELWSAREGAAGVRFAAMHPGWADTPGLQRSLPRFHRLTRPLLRDARQGADTIVWLATAPAAEVPGGRFWHDRRPRPTHRLPRTDESAEDRRALWRECQRLASP
jgi:dehydrogenase/reductase SDR family member 12